MSSFCFFPGGLRRRPNSSFGLALLFGLLFSLLAGAASALTVSTANITVTPTEVKQGDVLTVTWDSNGETTDSLVEVTLLASDLGVATNIAMEDPDADGVFAADVTVELPTSTDTAKVNVVARTDAGAIAAGSSGDIVVDNDPPIVSYGADSVLKDGIEISGSADETATGPAEVFVQLSWDKGVSWATQGAATDEGSGNWSYTFQDEILSDGEGLWFRVNAVDGVGNEGFGDMRGLSKNLFLTILTPTGDWINAADAADGVLVSGQFDGAPDNPEGYTLSELYNLTSDILRLRIFHGGGTEVRDLSVSTTIPDSQSWEHFLNATKMGSLDDGSIVIKTVMTDENGNLTFAASTLELDTEAPNAPVIDTVAEDDRINLEEQTNGVSISGTVSGADGQTLDLEITDGSTTVNLSATVAAGAWSAGFSTVQIDDFADGELTLTASVVDAAGNAGPAATRTVQKITTPPIVTFDNPLPGDANGDDVINSAEANAGFEVSGSVTGEVEGEDVRIEIWVLGDEDSYRYVKTGAAAADGTWSVDFLANQVNSLPDGANHIYFRASVTDIAGNSAVAEHPPLSEDGLSKDTQAPTISFNPVTGDNIINLAEQNAGVTISGSSTGANGRNLGLALQDSGGQILDLGPLTTDGTTGVWSVALSSAQITGLAEGEITLGAELSDLAGNQATQVRKFKKITSGPAVVLSDPLAGDDDAGTVDSPYAGDGVINAAELVGGFMVDGNTDGAVLNGNVNLKLQTLNGVNWVDTYSATTVIDGGGAWFHTFSELQIAAIANGQDNIRFRAVVSDQAGNTDQQEVIFSKDVTAPTLRITSIDGVVCTPCNGYLTAANITDGITVSGTATDNIVDGANGQTVTVRALAGGVEQYVLTGDVAAGAWSVTFTQAQAESLPDATLTFEAKIADWAGNPRTVNATILKGALPLAVAITSPAQDLVLTNPAAGLTIDGTTTGIGATQVGLIIRDSNNNTLSRVATVTADTWSLTLTQSEINQLADGTVTLTARTSNPAGETAEDVRGIVKDTGIGTLQSISSGTADGYYTAGASINLMATMSQSVTAGSEFTVTLNSGATVRLVAPSVGATLSGAYLVQTGDAASRLNVTAISSVQLSDASGNQATTLALPPAGGNLADSSNLVIYQAKLRATIARLATTECPLSRNCKIGEAVQFKAKIWNAGPTNLAQYEGEVSFPVEGLGNADIVSIQSYGGAGWVNSRAVVGPRYLTLPADSAGTTHYTEVVFGGKALAADRIQASVLIEHYQDQNYQETQIQNTTVNTRDTLTVWETKTHPDSTTTWSGFVGQRATYSTAVAVPMHVAIKDASHALICGASSVNWDAATTGKIQVNDATCIGSLLQPASVPGTNISFINGGAEIRCTVRELDPTNRTIFLWGNCINPDANQDRLDPDGDGFPNIYDNAPLAAANSSECIAIAGEVNIVNKTYAEPYSCNASGTRLLAAGRNVKMASGANVLFFSGQRVVLLPGFTADAGSRFKAGIRNLLARPLAEDAQTESDPSAAARLAQPSASADSGAAAAPQGIVLSQDGLPAGLRDLLAAHDAEASFAMSDAQGRFVIFATEADLTSADRNAQSDVYLYRVAEESLQLISANALGEAGNGPSRDPWMDGAGRFAVFSSEADDLVAGDDNASGDVVLLDLNSGSLEAVTPLHSGNAAAHPMIASEQALVVYDALDAEGARRIFAYNYQWPSLGVTALTGGQEGIQHSPAISADGRFVTYLEARQQDCSLWVLDGWSGTHHHQACPEAVLGGDYRPMFSDSAEELLWLPAAKGIEPHPQALDNPLY